MKIKSIKFLVSLLVGMLVGLSITVFVKPTCLGPFIGVVLSAYMAKVASPRDGAIVGAIVLIPIGIYGFLLTALQLRSLEVLGILGIIPVLFIGVLLISGLGALFGLVVGKLFQITKEKSLIM